LVVDSYQKFRESPGCGDLAVFNGIYFFVLFFPPAARIFATLRLDKKEPKNQENLTLANAMAGAARKIFGPARG
jgi:hypothetical protein